MSDEDGFCVLCGRGPMIVEYGDEPTDICHSCAHEEVSRLRDLCRRAREAINEDAWPLLDEELREAASGP